MSSEETITIAENSVEGVEDDLSPIPSDVFHIKRLEFVLGPPPARKEPRAAVTPFRPSLIELFQRNPSSGGTLSALHTADGGPLGPLALAQVILAVIPLMSLHCNLI